MRDVVVYIVYRITSVRCQEIALLGTPGLVVGSIANLAPRYSKQFYKESAYLCLPGTVVGVTDTRIGVSSADELEP